MSLLVGIEIIERVSPPAHYPIEFLEVQHPVPITVSFLQHLLQLVIWDLFAHLRSNSLQILESDFIEVVLVEQLEDLEDLIFGIPGPHPVGHDVDELTNIEPVPDFLAQLSVDVADILLLGFHSESLHDGFQLTSIDFSSVLAIEYLEGLTELIHSFLVVLLGFAPVGSLQFGQPTHFFQVSNTKSLLNLAQNSQDFSQIVSLDERVDKITPSDYFRHSMKFLLPGICNRGSHSPIDNQTQQFGRAFASI